MTKSLILAAFCISLTAVATAQHRRCDLEAPVSLPKPEIEQTKFGLDEEGLSAKYGILFIKAFVSNIINLMPRFFRLSWTVPGNLGRCLQNVAVVRKVSSSYQVVGPLRKFSHELKDLKAGATEHFYISAYASNLPMGGIDWGRPLRSVLSPGAQLYVQDCSNKKAWPLFGDIDVQQVLTCA